MKRFFRKQMWLLGLMVPVTAMLVLYIAVETKAYWFSWTYPIGAYIAIPILDFLIGTDFSNRTAEEEKALSNSYLYAFGLYLYTPVLLLLVTFGAWIVATKDLPLTYAIGVATTVGMATGVGFINSHELVHRIRPLNKWLAKIAQAPTMYGHHFSVYHTKFHHKHVATPIDPTSARYGETYWKYLPRAVIGGVLTAWQVERQASLGKTEILRFLRNECLQAWSLSVLFFGILTAFFGWIVLPFLIFQAIYAILLLEGVNYTQHYGLLRKKEADGRYERCGPQHSWDSNHLIVTLYIYQLQRHADHHAYPGRAYPALRYHPQTPQLPASYVSMVFVAFVPPIWFKVMNKRVMELCAGDLTQLNLLPQTQMR